VLLPRDDGAPRRLRPAPPPEDAREASDEGSWPGGTPPGLAASAVVFVLAAVAAEGWHVAAARHQHPMLALAVQTLFCLLLLAGAVLVVESRGAGPAALGWRAARQVREYGPRGLLLPVGIILAAQLAVVALVGRSTSPPTASASPVPSVPYAAVDLVVVTALVPFAEETLFRGLLLGGQLRRWAPSRAPGPTAAIVALNASAFALVHTLGPPFEVAALLQWFAVGLGCGTLAVRDGALLRPVVAHAGVNLTVTLLQWLG
jgi:membrane protease YdiL (CAAX protease family)